MITKFSGNVYRKILKSLENHHALFYKLWDMGEPVFDDSVKTAAVSFDELGMFYRFSFNPEFWKILTPYERKFVICHEALHVFLNHGRRTLNIPDEKKEDCNGALDIVTNHLLLSRFGFKREKMELSKDICWVDSVFPDRLDVENEKSFEYYYNLFPELTESEFESFSGKLIVDEHSTLPTTAHWGELILDLTDELSDEEKDSISDLLSAFCKADIREFNNDTFHKAGTISLGQWKKVKKKKIKKKKKWETVIRKWSIAHKVEYKDLEQWARPNRRLAFLTGDLLLPSDVEFDIKEKNKIDVYFFIDTSNSCLKFKQRFYDAALSLDPKRFKLHCFTFDADVFDLQLHSGYMRGGGGTKFGILEDKIISDVNDGGKYPGAVFVMTDGYGNSVTPKHPGRWHWFLTLNYLHYIPSKSHVFDLKGFI